MATKGAIARMKGQAINRMAQAMTTIAADLGVDALDLATIRHHDPAYQEAKRLEALAEWTDQVQMALLGVQPETRPDPQDQRRLERLFRVLADDLPTRTKAEMIAFAAQNGVDANEALTKDELAVQIAAQLTGVEA